MPAERDVVWLDERDNVATALRALPAGSAVTIAPGRTVASLEDVPFLHKLAVADIAPGAPIVKYGEVIGAARQRIPAGALVHVHNLRSLRGQGRG
jgi:altronate dehydratase small subunit